MGKPYLWYPKNMRSAANPVGRALPREPSEERPSDQSLERWPAAVRVQPLEPEQEVLLGQGRKLSPRVTRSKYRARPCSISRSSRTCLYRFTRAESGSVPRLVRRSNASLPDVSESLHCN